MTTMIGHSPKNSKTRNKDGVIEVSEGSILAKGDKDIDAAEVD